MAHLAWNKIKTVLLDMDGTLLDLHFDTYFWLTHLPQAWAKKEKRPVEKCKAELSKLYSDLQGKIEWYCLDFWADKLQMDMVELKREVDHLIRFRPDAIPFLDVLRASHREVALVTNAHPGSLSLKIEKTKLDSHIDTLISTHRFGVTKESQLLWEKLQSHLGFDPSTTLFVDDSQVILDAAKEFGIQYTLGINNPDSQTQWNDIKGHVAITDFGVLLDDAKQMYGEL